MLLQIQRLGGGWIKRARALRAQVLTLCESMNENKNEGQEKKKTTMEKFRTALVEPA